MNLWDQIRSTETRRGLVELYPTWAGSTERQLGSTKNAYLISSTVHAAVNARSRVFSEARFAFRNRTSGDLTGDHASLALLQNPWPGGTETELFKRLELDASISGNAYAYKARPDLIQMLDPDRVEVLTDGREKVGYLYWRNGYQQGTPRSLAVNEVAHWAPLPHPNKAFMGAAWIEVVATELRTDIKMVRHQEKFFDNAATPNVYVKVKGTMSAKSREALRGELEKRYTGVANAWRTLVMDSDAEMHAVGANFKQMDYVNVMTSTEGRIASAAGVPPIILHLKAGLDAATYSNYGMAMRAFADHLIRPNWNSVVAALAPIVNVPRGSELWFDDRQVAALRQDKDAEAEIQSKQASAIRQLIDAGFVPETVVDAVTSNEFDRLKHSGNVSVQLQPADPNAQEPV